MKVRTLITFGAVVIVLSLGVTQHYQRKATEQSIKLDSIQLIHNSLIDTLKKAQPKHIKIPKSTQRIIDSIEHQYDKNQPDYESNPDTHDNDEWFGYYN